MLVHHRGMRLIHHACAAAVLLAACDLPVEPVPPIAAGARHATELRARDVAGRFRVMNTGLPRADALNDQGALVWLASEPERTTLGFWTRHDEWSYDISGVVDPCYSCHQRNLVAGFNGEGAVVIARVYLANQSLYRDNHGWVWRDGLAGSFRGTPRDINDAGQVVGYTQNKDGRPIVDSAFVWQAGQTVSLAGIALAGGSTRAVAINDHAQVAVNSWRSCVPGAPFCESSPARAWVWSAGSYAPVPAPDSACGAWEAIDINNDGHVLVRCTSGAAAVSLWDGVTVTEVSLASASALNDRGEVVGWEPDGPYVWRDGRAVRVIQEPATSSTSMRINNSGQILLNLPDGAYLLTPVPSGR